MALYEQVFKKILYLSDKKLQWLAQKEQPNLRWKTCKEYWETSYIYIITEYWTLPTENQFCLLDHSFTASQQEITHFQI